jgi:hypothetical protein
MYFRERFSQLSSATGQAAAITKTIIFTKIDNN